MSTQQTEALPALIERFRGLHFDHAPDGWPAVRTREITALLDRITELESQLAQRFDAADMATAAAQGFRDGVASLSANAGEPRNAIDRDALIDAIAQGLHGTWHCTRAWEAWHVGTMSQDDFEPVDESETPTEIADAVLALLAAPPTAQAEGWISVKDRLPEKNTEVLICFAELSIPSTGQYTASALDHEGWRYPQENHLWPGERPDFEDGGSPTVTHWMPLPAAPGPADGESNE